MALSNSKICMRRITWSSSSGHSTGGIQEVVRRVWWNNTGGLEYLCFRPYISFAMRWCVIWLYWFFVEMRITTNLDYFFQLAIVTNVNETLPDFLWGDQFSVSWFFFCQLHCLFENLQLNNDVSEPLEFLVVCYEDFELERIRKEAGRGVIETLSWLLPGAAEKTKTSG